MNNHLHKIENKKIWWPPFSLFITLIIVPTTAEFKKTFGIPACTLQTMCYCGIFIFLILTIKTGWQAYKLKKINVASLINEIKTK